MVFSGCGGPQNDLFFTIPTLIAHSVVWEFAKKGGESTFIDGNNGKAYKNLSSCNGKLTPFDQSSLCPFNARHGDVVVGDVSCGRLTALS